jgi:hypothetical protein
MTDDYAATVAKLDDKALLEAFAAHEHDEDRERADIAAAEMERRNLDF